jgi:hypothetical protein
MATFEPQVSGSAHAVPGGECVSRRPSTRTASNAANAVGSPLRTNAAGEHDSTATTTSRCSAQIARNGSFLVRRNDLSRLPGQTVVVAAFALIASAFFRPAAPPTPTSIAVRGDVQIGRYLVHWDGTLDGAIRAFGRPTSLRRGRYQDCVAVWRRIGLRIGFYNLGGRNPCLRQYGYFSNATMVGRHWVTARGFVLAILRGGFTSCTRPAASQARGHGC